MRTKGLIESDWNLKYVNFSAPITGDMGLIESDWNLKLNCVSLIQISTPD